MVVARYSVWYRAASRSLCMKRARSGECPTSGAPSRMPDHRVGHDSGRTMPGTLSRIHVFIAATTLGPRQEPVSLLHGS